MASSKIIPLEYQGQACSFNSAGWINATEAAKQFDKRPVDWLRLGETREYLAVLAETLNCEPSSLLKTRRGRYGSGTWLHPKLGVRFAQWLSTRFAVWCDMQIDRLIHSNADDWQHLRDSVAIGYQGMCDALKISRQAQGKSSARHHFINEARLINSVVLGQFKGVDRDALSLAELRVLALIEQRNTFLMGQGLDYQQRKAELTSYAQEQLMPKLRGGAV